MAEQQSVSLAKDGESNNQYWQDIARTYRIETTANSFNIPERSWNHPTVHSFVETTLNARDLQAALYAGDVKHSYVGQLNYAQHGSEPGKEVPPGAPGMNPPLSKRYMDGELLMRGVTMILEDGLDAKAANLSDYLAGKIGIATQRFGVMVTHLPEEATRAPEVQVPTAMPGSAWADFGQADRTLSADEFFDRYAARYGKQNYHLWGDDSPREKNMAEEQARSLETARRLGIPEQNVKHSTVQEFVSHLHDMEDLLRTLEQGETPPGAPGITPSVTERYTMGEHLLRVAVGIMEEGFQGRTVEPQFVASHVNSALSYYGLQARLQME